MMIVKFGPMMTADEAKKRFCHLTMPCPDDTFCCHADECVAWMWLEDIRNGMVPREQYMALKQEALEASQNGRRLGFCCK